jgi:flagellar biosynthesis protein FliQ
MNYDDSLVDLVRSTLLVTMKIAAPLLGAGIVIGLTISIVQAITSIQDQALSFVPKIVGMVLVAILLMPWITRRLVDFTAEMLGALMSF